MQIRSQRNMVLKHTDFWLQEIIFYSRKGNKNDSDYLKS